MIFKPNELEKYLHIGDTVYGFNFDLTSKGVAANPPAKGILHAGGDPSDLSGNRIRYFTPFGADQKTPIASRTTSVMYKLYADNLDDANRRYQQLICAAHGYHVLQALYITEYDLNADYSTSIVTDMKGPFKRLKTKDFIDLLESGQIKPGSQDFYLCAYPTVNTKRIFKNPITITSAGSILTFKKGEDIQVITVAHEDLERVVFGDEQNRYIVFQKL